jgi:AAA15 family ATPase/GTPase
MIRSFSAKNFWSIKERQAVDLVVDDHASDSEHFREIKDGDRVPAVVAIYGHNGSGKTALLRVPRFLADFLTNSFHYEASRDIGVQPFLSKDSEERPSELEVSFDLREESDKWVTYTYEISVTKKRVLREALYYTPERKRRLMFERHAGSGNAIELKTGPDFGVSANDPMREKVAEKASVISTFAQFNHPVSLKIRSAASGVFSNVFVFGRGDYPSEQVASQIFSNDGEMRDWAKAFLRYADLGIEDFSIHEHKDTSAHQPNNPVQTFTTLFTHTGLSRPLVYAEQSHGTQAMYRLLPIVLGPLKFGTTSIVDEMDSDIHPLVMPKILDLFHSKKSNKLNAQLFLSGHNPYTLSFLEKEQVYFTEKDRNGQTAVIGLRDIKGVRRSDNYFLKYLGGTYGGVPR